MKNVVLISSLVGSFIFPAAGNNGIKSKGVSLYDPCDFANYIYYDIKVRHLNTKYLYIHNESEHNIQKILNEIPDSIVGNYDPAAIKIFDFLQLRCEGVNKKLLSRKQIYNLKVDYEYDSIGKNVMKPLEGKVISPTENLELWNKISSSKEYEWYSEQRGYQTPRFIYFYDFVEINPDKVIIVLAYNGTIYRDRELSLLVYVFERNLKTKEWDVTHW